MKLNPYKMCRCTQCSGARSSTKAWQKREVHRRFRHKDRERIRKEDYELQVEVALMVA